MERFSLSIDIITLIGYVAASYAAIIFAYLYKSHYRKTKTQEKFKYTYEFCLQQQNTINKIYDAYITNSFNISKLNNDKDRMRELEILNQIAIGVNNGILEEKIVKSMFEGAFISSIKRSKYLMFSTSEMLDNPYIFSDFQVLAEKWQREQNVHRRSE